MTGPHIAVVCWVAGNVVALGASIYLLRAALRENRAQTRGRRR